MPHVIASSFRSIFCQCALLVALVLPSSARTSNVRTSSQPCCYPAWRRISNKSSRSHLGFHAKRCVCRSNVLRLMRLKRAKSKSLVTGQAKALKRFQQERNLQSDYEARSAKDKRIDSLGLWKYVSLHAAYFPFQ